MHFVRFCVFLWGKDKKHQKETAFWSSGVNLNLDGMKKRHYPIQGFNGPAYSIPSQYYPGRVSPDKTDRTARTPNQQPASSRSPNRDVVS